MQNRMDKYSVDSKIGSRTERNKTLYESVKNSSMKNYEIKSNISIIDDDADIINVSDVRRMLDERYKENGPKRKSIELPEMETNLNEDVVQDTKEYDINAILAKAKQGKNVDYSKERLKKIRQTQYDILNNLDLEIKSIEEKSKSKSEEAAEANLKNLINTITELEIKNKKKDVSTELDLLSDLSGDDNEEKIDANKAMKKEEVFEKEEHPTNEICLVKTEENDNSKDKSIKKESSPNNQDVQELIKEIKENTSNIKKVEQNEKPAEEAVEKTLNKLDVKANSYDDFADVSKRDSGSIILKIIIFIIIIVLVLGALYILNDILGLGLF